MKKDSILHMPSCVITNYCTVEFEYKTKRGNLKRRTAKFALNKGGADYAKSYFFTRLEYFNESHKTKAYQDVKILDIYIEERIIRDWKCS